VKFARRHTPRGAALALDWSDGALRDLVPAQAGHNDDAENEDERLAYDTLLASSTHARAHGYVQFPGVRGEPARYAAAVRDFRGIVLAALELTERSAHSRGRSSVPPEQAVVRAAGALSSELGFEG
jgi:DNA-binding IclR family transcriptional regulator